MPIEYIAEDCLGIYLPQPIDRRLVLPRLKRGLSHPNLLRYTLIAIPSSWAFVEYQRLDLSDCLQIVTARRWMDLPNATSVFNGAITRAALLVSARTQPVVEFASLPAMPRQIQG